MIRKCFLSVSFILFTLIATGQNLRFGPVAGSSFTTLDFIGSESYQVCNISFETDIAPTLGIFADVLLKKISGWTFYKELMFKL